MSIAFLLMPWIHGHDGAGYYSLARSIVVDGDLNLENEYAYFQQDLNLATMRRDPNTGKIYSQYPVGTSLIWLPAVYAAHGVSLLLGEPATGFTKIYYWFTCFWSALLAFIAFTQLFRFLQSTFDRSVAFWAALAGWLGTNLFYYMFFEASMSHAVSFFLMTMFFLQCYQLQYGKPTNTYSAWSITGVLAGLIFITRYQDGIVWLLPGVIALRSYVNIFKNKRYVDLGPTVLAHSLMVLAIAITVSPDLILNFLQHENIWASGPNYYYGAFHTDQWWYALKVLFSPHHGLIYWHPVVGVGILGLFMLPRPQERILLLTVIFLQVLVTGFWSFWHAAQSFGHRFFVGYIPLFIYGLCCLQKHVGKQGIRIVRVLFAVLILLNLLLMMQYGLRMIPAEGPLDITQFIANLDKIPEIVEGVLDFIRSKVVPEPGGS